MKWQIPFGYICRGEGLDKETLWICPSCGEQHWISIYGEAKCEVCG